MQGPGRMQILIRLGKPDPEEPAPEVGS
jgi:hypothetical protein